MKFLTDKSGKDENVEVGTEIIVKGLKMNFSLARLLETKIDKGCK